MSSDKQLTVGLLQTDPIWEAPDQNMAAIETLLGEQDLSGVDVVLLPEMFTTGFSMNPERVASANGGKVERWMQQMARRHDMALIGSHIEDTGSGYANTAVAFDAQGNELARYQKAHLFVLEKDIYQAGDDVVFFELGPFKASMFICYDIRFPELYRHASACGAELIFTPACWPASRRYNWDLLTCARALENQCFLCGCNRTGNAPEERYDGHSVIATPRGEELLKLDDLPQFATATIEREYLLSTRKNVPALQDRREELYRNLMMQGKTQ